MNKYIVLLGCLSMSFFLFACQGKGSLQESGDIQKPAVEERKEDRTEAQTKAVEDSTGEPEESTDDELELENTDSGDIEIEKVQEKAIADHSEKREDEFQIRKLTFQETFFDIISCY